MHGIRVRLVLGVFFAALLILGAAAPAKAKYASIVIDAATGEVLHEAHADDRNYPASLTKMMTLYLAFEALEQGRLKLETRLPVSKYAASRAPSKLGLMPGESISVRDVILGLVTKSANDAAVVMAEGIAGAESLFAQRMTQKAHELGMTSTTFRNASGLPDPEQLTTARDFARLSQALLRRFPQYYRYFSTDDFTYKGVVHHNHNRLMQGFEGMDGIKTGFIRASGFNLAASAMRGNRRLIGVVMGGQSARARDLHMADLLEDAFAGRRSLPPIQVAEKEPGIGSRVVARLNPISNAHAAAPAAARAATAESDDWAIQVGAYVKQSAARSAAQRAATKLRNDDAEVLVLAPFKSDKRKVYRARLVGLSEAEARDACRVLKKSRTSCALIAP
jgi:D-alanyl-D-alanine carboxypeptidase